MAGYAGSIGGLATGYGVPQQQAGLPGTAGGSLPFGPTYNYSPTAGGIPSVPNPITSQQSALSGDLSSASGIEALTQFINNLSLQFAGQQNQLNQQQAQYNVGLNNQEQAFINQMNQNLAQTNQASALAAAQSANQQNAADILRQYQQYVPGLGGLESQQSANTASELAGQVPQGVINLLAQQAAERGQGRGMGVDAPASQAALEQALGITSLQQEQAGAQNLSGQMASVPGLPLASVPIAQTPYASAPGITAPYSTANPFDPSGLLVSPADMQAWQNYANQLNAAPIPGAAQQYNLQAMLQAIQAGRGAGGYGGQQQQNPATNPALQTPTAADQLGQSTYYNPTGSGGGSLPNYGTSPGGFTYDPTQGTYVDPYGNPITPDTPGYDYSNFGLYE